MRRVLIFVGLGLLYVAAFAFMASIKPAVSWIVRDWSLTSLVVANAIGLALALSGIAWTDLLQPALLRRRQER